MTSGALVSVQDQFDGAGRQDNGGEEPCNRETQCSLANVGKQTQRHLYAWALIDNLSEPETPVDLCGPFLEKRSPPKLTCVFCRLAKACLYFLCFRGFQERPSSWAGGSTYTSV